MRVVFVRHGESLEAAQNICQTYNVELSEKGVEQAEKTVLKLKGQNFDIMYYSPLKRAQQTAQIINKQLQIPTEELKYLEEEKRPSEIEGKSNESEFVINVKKELADRYADKSYRYSDEDTFEILKTRGINLMNFLKSHNKENVLCVCHGMIMKMFYGLTIKGTNLEAMEFLEIVNSTHLDNTGISIFNFDNNWTNVGWNLSSIN